MAGIDISPFAHSPVNKAIILKDYNSLKSILEALPKLSNPHDIHTEAASIAEDEKAGKISAVVDRRDGPNRETPLHLAAKLGDKTTTEMLMLAGANKNLKNKQGLSALRVSIAAKHDEIAMIMIRHSWPLIHMKWHRRLPRYKATLRRMKDFYMEISFHFESSVIPFISRIAPSDTYKIWKRGGNMRADMTLAGFDGLKIKRADQSIIFLGDGLNDEKKSSKSLYIISHKKKEVFVETFITRPTTEDFCKRILAKKSREPLVVRFGIDVSQAVLEPQMTWRRKERKEMVGPWKTRVYDMHNIFFWAKSKSLSGAKTDEKFPSKENEKASEEIESMLTEEERKQLEAARTMDTLEESSCKTREKKGQSGGKKEKEKERKETKTPSVNTSSGGWQSQCNGNGETELKRGMRPVLWLSQDYPLKVEELLPLLDLLAEKVKAVRRLRELLTTSLPKGTFPVKVSIPCVPSVRVIVTFSKFEELPTVDDEFSSAPSTPTEADSDDPAETSSSSGSWFQWDKKPNCQSSSDGNEDLQDLFRIPPDYNWISSDDKNNKKQRQKKKS